MGNAGQESGTIRIALATEQDRETIYRLRHDVYASELAQHPENPEGRLTDRLDGSNTYITASLNGDIAGFISCTPPGQSGYAIEKYLSRQDLPVRLDERSYEVRLLTVVPAYRGSPVAALLMYAARRWIEGHGGTQVIGMGRKELMGLYRKVGLQPTGIDIQSGAVQFELFIGTFSTGRERLRSHAPLLKKLASRVDWQLEIPFSTPLASSHGGAFFEAIGEEFASLEKSQQVINADVLDAWYPPSPRVVAALQEHLSWLVRTSPPTGCEGMIRAIARGRGVLQESVLVGGGSSDLIFLALRQWLTPVSRVLLLDPSYGEYAHVCENVIGCQVDRLPLQRRDGYMLDLSRLEASLSSSYDLLVLVNPNNPTGRHVPKAQLEQVLRRAPEQTRIWVDEAYVDYAGPGQSLEGFAAVSKNVVVCKSMSKVYALSGLRAGYLCGPPDLVAELKLVTPPWAVSLPAQVAAVKALEDLDYYAECWRATHALRAELVPQVSALGTMEIVPSVANFMLCHLDPEGPDAAQVIAGCRRHQLYLRDASAMGSQLGRHALRIAVKDAETNRRMVDILERVLHEETR